MGKPDDRKIKILWLTEREAAGLKSLTENYSRLHIRTGYVIVKKNK